jgi:uncharacterized protein with PQ loop repeat
MELEENPDMALLTLVGRMVAPVVVLIGVLRVCLNKVPVMINILNAKSASGLSATAVYAETVAYANFLACDILFGSFSSSKGSAETQPAATRDILSPFVYIDGAILIQSVIVTMLVWHYSTPPASKVKRGIALSVAVVYIFVVGFVLPATYRYFCLPTTYKSLLYQSATLTLLYSKCSQVWVTQSCRHTGPQSLVTTLLENACSWIVLIGTFSYGVLSDPRETLKTALNLIMLLQLFYFNKNTKLHLADLKVAASRKD